MKNRGNQVQTILALGGLAALLSALASATGESLHPAPMVLTALLVAPLTYSLIPTGAGDANLSHSVALAAGLTFGLKTAALGLAIGLLAGHSLPFIQRFLGRRPPSGHGFMLALGDAGQQLIAVVSALAAFHSAGGMPLALRSEFITSPQIATTTVSFLLIFSTIRLIQISARAVADERSNRAFFTFVVLISLLPVPYAVLTSAATSLLGPAALLVLGGMLAILSPIVRSLIVAERTSLRRYAELDSLHQVSQALRTSLNMQSLLNAIYAQVAHLLGVNSFFVALYEPESHKLTYPLAIKNGRRQEWPSRPLSDRLTDRVVLTGEPLLIPADAELTLKEMGFPELENAPQAWLGVPLTIPQRVLGCLGVFHTEPGNTLSKGDLNLLITVAGQAAVAIENANLYAKTEQRAQALATINLISASMSSSLDPAETLDLVVHSLAELGGGSKAALFLLKENREYLELAHSQGLSAEFLAAFNRLESGGDRLAEAFFQPQISTQSELPDSGLSELHRAAFLREGINAWVSLPLETPAGTIGMASVYFDQPQRFRPEQIELLETLAAHSSLALANARAHAATDEALHQQIDHLSRIEAIGRELVSTLNPDDLFNSIVEHSLKATGAEAGYLAVREPEDRQLEIVASRSTVPAPEVKLKVLGLEGTLAGEAFELQDALGFDEASLKEIRGTINRASRSALAAPIIRWGRGIGLIAVESRDANAFETHHIDFLRHLAVQASIAIGNANLYQQLEENLRELSLLYQASVQVSTTLDLESVTMAVADSVSVALQADSVHVSTWDPATQTLITVATVEEGRPRESIRDRSADDQRAPAVWSAIQAGAPLQTRADRAKSPADVAYMADLLNSVSMLALPLRLGRETVGMVEVGQRQLRTFNESEIRAAQTIASQAAMAIQNSELFRRIRTSHDRLLAVLNSTEEGMAMVSTLGRVVLANRRIFDISGLADGELIGLELAELPNDTLTRLGFTQREAREFNEAAESQTFRDSSLTQYRIEALEAAIIERIVHPIRDAAGELIGRLIVLRDVTEREEIDAARAHLTEMIVHDLRSPLTTLLGSLHLLGDVLDERLEKETGEQALRVSRRGVQQMLGLVNSLLDVARLESRELQLDLTDFDLHTVLDSLADVFIPSANEQGVIFSCRSPDREVLICADEEKVRRSLMNLVDNAIKFTPEGGQVHVDLRDRDRVVEVTVADSGPGIPEDMREKVFERFARVPGTRGRRRGTGLGLAFAKLALEAHGGTISVEDNPGGGSLFRAHLPKRPQATHLEQPIEVAQAMDSPDSIR